MKSKELKVFPNPAGGFVNIVSNGKLTSIEILNISGKVVANKRFNGNKITINTQNMSGGTYIVRATGENKPVITTKFFLKK
jgi:hypothetical protein